MTNIMMTKLYIESTGGLEFPGGLMVKGLALPLLWPRFDPWPRNFHMPQAQTKIYIYFFN